MEKKAQFIKGALRRSPDFREDLQKFLDLGPDAWPAAKKAGIDAVQGLLYGENLTDAADKLSATQAEAQRMTVMFRFLTARLADGGDANDFVDELIEFAGKKDFDPAHRAALAQILVPEPQLRAEEREREAFTFGNSIASVETKSLVTFHLDGEPFAGVSLTINYLDGGNNDQSISLNMSSGEIRAVANSLLHAAEKVEKELAAIRGVSA
ncbi:TPA: hypothetical protein RNS88_003636 [Stenotrophomonas maltophilia]|nr:hypothetical protein [Stenotrophomonas sp.]HDX0923699.1 hypothetical protein [Stenotrophomonas maltophilia]